jgi:uncharacterized membrane protein
MEGCVVLLPIVGTAYATRQVVDFFDHFFSPAYEQLFGFHVVGLGLTSAMSFILLNGIFANSYLGGLIKESGEWIIAKIPMIKQVYSAAKQISSAFSPSQGTNGTVGAFRECVLIRHPRHGEYAYGFITGTTLLHLPEGSTKVYTVYVPTNHLYIGDVFMLGTHDVFRSNLTVAEGIEVVISLGMGVPKDVALVPKSLDERQERCALLLAY